MKKKYSDTRSLLVLAIIVAAIYARGLTHGFALDDRTFFLDNDILPALRPWDLGAVFLSLSNYWGDHAPIRDFLFVLQHFLFGTTTPGYHIVSLLLYLATGAVMHRFLKRLYTEQGGDVTAMAASGMVFSGPLLVIAFFLLHPLHVESVANISGQKEVLYTLLSFAALLVFISALREGTLHSWKQGSLFLVLYYGSFLAKAAAVSTVLFLPVVWFLFLRRPADPWGRAAGLWCIVNIPVLFWLLGTMGLRARYSGAMNLFAPDMLPDRVLRGVKVLGAHIRLLVKPCPLNFGYPFDDTARFNIDMAVGAGAAAVLCAVLVLAWRRDRLLAGGAALFSLYFLPYVQPFSAAAFVYDRYLFAALLGAGMMLERSLAFLALRFPAVRQSLTAAAAVLLFALAFQSAGYVPAFASDRAMARNSYERFPDWPESSFGYAYALIETGEPDAARELVLRERTMDEPAWVRDYFLGWIALEQGEIAEAIRRLERSLDACLAGGYYPYPSVPLGRALIRSGQPDRARTVLRYALDLVNYQPVESYHARKLLATLDASAD